jgi:hypothetical protein
MKFYFGIYVGIVYINYIITMSTLNIDSWTHNENYMVRETQAGGRFALIINFDQKDVKPYLYEYNSMLEHLMELQCDVIEYHDKAYNTYRLVKFMPTNQFVVLCENRMTDVFMVGQFDSEEDAVSAINTDKQKGFHYAIADLSKVTPWFLKDGCLVKRKENEHVALFV